eukprot:TRINITY_DN993_c0_g1_i1.p1 TRINITY_DN993_c0_g1~~TRINITY_DN993_c0_g1_i1.p1  ORF type:complete len:479 (-),score=108.62 TRINITY_DN993_c0_g1_i1:70-1506(-)
MHKGEKTRTKKNNTKEMSNSSSSSEPRRKVSKVVKKKKEEKEEDSESGFFSISSDSESGGLIVSFSSDSDSDTDDSKSDKKFAKDLSSAKLRLSPSFSPECLVGREYEKEQIELFFRNNISKCSPGSLYVAGVPGTGKTATLNQIIDTITIERQLKNDKILTIKCNCVSLTTEKKFYERILLCLNVKDRPDKAPDMLRKIEEKLRFLSKSSIPVILMMDEIDQLKADLIYNIYKWPNMQESSTIIVGISNELSFIEKFPKLLTLKYVPKTIHFGAYDKNQIIEILKNRLGPQLALYRPEVFQLIAMRSASNGDIRRALDIATKALLNLQNRAKGNEAGQQAMVEMKDVLEVLKGVSNLDVAGIQQLPNQQKIILVCMVNLSQEKQLDFGKILKEYRRVCSLLGLSGSLPHNEFMSSCELLGSTEYVEINRISKSKAKSKNAVPQELYQIHLKIPAILMAHATKGTLLEKALLVKTDPS